MAEYSKENELNIAFENHLNQYTSDYGQSVELRGKNTYLYRSRKRLVHLPHDGLERGVAFRLPLIHQRNLLAEFSWICHLVSAYVSNTCQVVVYG